MTTSEKFTFFYGGPFSNFYPVYFMDSDGVTYSCTEQYYMAKKALFFKDSFNYEKIMAETNPKQQKFFGRKVANFDKAKWYGLGTAENPAKKIMFDGNYLKYSQNEALKKILLKTEGTTLVEASPFDTVWGIGMDANNYFSKYRRYWKGKNWLGEVLTQVRDKLIAEKNFLF